LIAAIERANEEKIPNLKFICTNAACLPRYIPEHTISRIYLNFSNPLPRKVNTKQRLTSDRFLEIYKRILTEKGEIFMKTDDMHFFEFSLEEFSKNGFKLRNISLDLHKSNISDNIVTEHEKKFSDLGLPIYRLEAYLN
jgi:tRNA (guanine-N7-)-methyltransferase